MIISIYLCAFSTQQEALLILNRTTVEAEFNVTVSDGEDMQRDFVVLWPITTWLRPLTMAAVFTTT